MPEPKIRTTSYFSTTLTIDDVAIDVRVKRMTNVEFDAFAEGLAQTSGARGSTDDPGATKAGDLESSTWMRDTLDAYLTIAEGEVEHDGQPVVKGGQLLDLYGARMDIVPQAIALVFGENRLSDTEKKTFRSALGSRFGFESERPSEAAGDAPAPTAESAAPPPSVPAAAATAPASSASSGTTDPSSFAPVRSSRSPRRLRARSAGSSGRTSS